MEATLAIVVLNTDHLEAVAELIALCKVADSNPDRAEKLQAQIAGKLETAPVAVVKAYHSWYSDKHPHSS
jgi:hypothetical protein